MFLNQGILVFLLLISAISLAEPRRCQCGIEGNISINRIINGTFVLKGKYPWFARISSGCGGALISDRHILTGAHCFRDGHIIDKDVASVDVSKYAVVLGVNSWAPAKNLQMESIIRHRNYSHQTHHDIAIIKLKEPVKFENGMNPICLPDFDETDNVFAYGLGYQNLNNTHLKYNNLFMHEVELTRLSYEDCSKRWRNNRYNVSFCTLPDPGTINSICMGDSGAPVSTRKDGRIYEIGIPSGTPGDCNVNNKPQKVIQQHEKVFAHLDWIRKHTQDGVFCEAEHHPFAKPGKSRQGLVNSNLVKV